MDASLALGKSFIQRNVTQQLWNFSYVSWDGDHSIAFPSSWYYPATMRKLALEVTAVKALKVCRITLFNDLFVQDVSTWINTFLADDPK
jgi:hypothetical protein